MKDQVATLLGFVLFLGLAVYSSNGHDHDSTATSITSSAPDVGADDATTPEFHGFDCTDDCSGHEAGYRWAEEHDITDETICGGNSESFIEGCQAYAREHEDEDIADDDPDSDE